jgi:RNA polymerase sigma-70 factor, ECF subfamily
VHVSASTLVADALRGRSAGRLALVEHVAHHPDDLDDVLDVVALGAAGGDGASLELLLEIVHRLGLARPSVTRLITDAASVDDAVQATLVAIERRIDRYEGRARFRTWLWAVARNEALMQLRRRRDTPTADIADAPAPGGRLSSVIATRETIAHLVDGLAEPYRTTLRLQLDEQLDYDAIAVRLDVPIGTVRSRLAKARAMLAARLA